MALERYPNLLSFADYMRLPPDTPGEVIDGILTLGPAPNFYHQNIADRIMRFVGIYLDEHPEVGQACSAPMDVVLRLDRPAMVLQPDVLFVSAAREHLIERVVMGAPDLAVEVLSPSNARHDLGPKKDAYEHYGVTEYWVVWPDERRVDVYRRGAGTGFEAPRSFGEADTLETPLLPGFGLTLAKVFAKRV